MKTILVKDLIEKLNTNKFELLDVYDVKGIIDDCTRFATEHPDLKKRLEKINATIDYLTWGNTIMIFKDENVVLVAYVSGHRTPFIFGDVVVIPGDEATAVYNIRTKGKLCR